MSDIYRNAMMVLIWLGPRSWDSDLAMHVLGKPVRYWRDSQQFYEMWTPEHSSAIERLFQRPYWTRLWIFQEIALAGHKLLMCGRKCITWESFADFVDVVDHKWTTRSEVRLIPTESRGDSKKIWASIPSEALDSVHAVRECPAMPVVKRASQSHQVDLRCVEPRDKVYALLGIAARTHTKIEPDYTVPLPTLLHSVLEDRHQSKPPEGVHEVELQCEALETLLGVRKRTMLAIFGQKGRLSTLLLAPPETGIGPTNSPVDFWWAVFHGHTVVEDMLTRVNKTCNQSNYLELRLGFAVLYGHEALVEMLLALKVINTDYHLLTKIRKQETGYRGSYLDTALRHGHVGIARRLLDTGYFDVNALLPGRPHPQRRLRPLHLAVHYRDVSMVELLLSISDINVER
ncbi:hypothetical protein LTR56_014325 [Elasticomyces elasticus]|nr:hypothetical protein LTR56_014325 [Elasticomyces elasticus]KAK4916581.1 hypothetical protein LTR49_015414 [Elasticomyces elasticus]